MNLEVADQRSSLLSQITLTLSVHVSKNLVIFGDSAVNRRLQISNMLSGVIGVKADNINVQALAPPDAGLSLMLIDIVVTIPFYKSSYQEQRVRRLTLSLSRPETAVRTRVDSMFAQMIQSWSPDFVSGNKFVVFGASVIFPHTVSGMTGNRRLLGTTAPPPRDDTWNQTSQFFVRSYDAIDNSDSMLAFASENGLFSRMCIFSARYSLASYCTLSEQDNLKIIQTLLSEPLREASNGQIQECTAVALAPAESTFCEASSDLLPPIRALPSPMLSSRRSSTTPLDSILFHIEVIVYSNTTGTLTLLATNALRSAGVEQIRISATKKIANDLAVALDKAGFQTNGVLLLSEGDNTDNTNAEFPAVLVVVVLSSVFVFICCVLHLKYRHQQNLKNENTITTQNDPVVQYTPLNLLGANSSCMLQYNTTSAHTTRIHEDDYAAWRGRVA